ncbi:MAG: hypothetical protein AAF211_19080 [Myxococcota bacterium]
MNQDPDHWLDAFDPAEVDDPTLQAFDRAVSRLRGQRPPRRRRGRWGLAVAAALGLALGATSLLESREVEEAPRSAPPPVVEGPVPEVPVPPSVAPPEPPAPAPVVRRAPGLLPYEGASLTLAEGAAVLDRGVVRYLRDDDHDPGVHEVRWSTLPLVAKPVGTDFTVAAAPGLGAMVVEEGTVRLQHTNGMLLAVLSSGDELSFVGDTGSPIGVRLLFSEGRPLDELMPGFETPPGGLVALVASLRLAVHPEDLPL